MPTNIRVIHAHDLIKATPDGQLDLNMVKEVLKEIASVSSPLSSFDVLVDTRKTQTTLSVTNLWYIAAELSDLGKPHSRKTAVLCPLEHFDLAEFFALCAPNRGLRVNAFTSFETAMEWLIEEKIDTK